MFAKSAYLLGLLALAGVAVVAGKSSSYTEFMAKAKPDDAEGKGQEIVGPIDNFTCAHNGAFPYPVSCELYVDCWEGEANLFMCTDDMLFDLRYLGCEFAQNVDCGDRPRPPGVSPTRTPPPSTTTTNYTTTVTPPPDSNFTCINDGVFQHDQKCEYYWSCYNGEATLIHCQLNFLFDLVYMGCNFPELTHCQDRERPEDAPGTTYTPPPSPTSTTPSVTSEVPVTEEPITETPNPDITTTAGPTTTPGPTTIRTTTPGGGEFVCPGDGYFSDPDNCEWFYQCAFGEAIHEQCPAGLYFNPIAQACDFPENVDCENRKQSRFSRH